jgi:SAM-dependent methyltransferase
MTLCSAPLGSKLLREQRSHPARSCLGRDQRFGKEEHYEWLKDFSHFRHLLSPLLSPSTSVRRPLPPILHIIFVALLNLNCTAICCVLYWAVQVLDVGCGNSRLGEALLREGVAGGITCIDLSPVAVQRMRDRLVEQGTSGKCTHLVDSPFFTETKGRYFLQISCHRLSEKSPSISSRFRCGGSRHAQHAVRERDLRPCD